MYLSNIESPPPVILSSSSTYRVGAPRSSNDIPGHLFVDSMEHGRLDNQNTILSGCEAYMEEVPVRSEQEADRVRLPEKQIVDQGYAAQDPLRRPEPVKAEGKKRQETDDEMSELEISDSRKTKNDATRQRGRPRLDTRDESPAERRRTQIRLAQRAYRLRKETTIASLRSRVAELETAIEGMQDAFTELHHTTTAIAGNNDHTLTNFLGSVTERFNTLSRMASIQSCEGTSCDEDADAYGADQSGEETIYSGRRSQSSRTLR
ncbi:hypothetical protein BGX38DRAFT_1265392 [Terfezia claveryi]|nr:hypothetical protein BGX38DRAFT_1265392 [Terfezia claveryi]